MTADRLNNETQEVDTKPLEDPDNDQTLGEPDAN